MYNLTSKNKKKMGKHDKFVFRVKNGQNCFPLGNIVPNASKMIKKFFFRRLEYDIKISSARGFIFYKKMRSSFFCTSKKKEE